MKVALYSRVSTADKEQNPDTQLFALRDYVKAEGWSVYKEYIDIASANDLRGRKEWRKLLDDVAKKKFQVVLVFRLDRAFRSVKHLHDTLQVWELAGVDFRSVREGFDTSTAIGRLLLNLLASLAEFELEVISERVRAGMSRARRQGKHCGRPDVFAKNPKLEAQWATILPDIQAGRTSVREAARLLKMSPSTIMKLRDVSKNGGEKTSSANAG